MMSFTSADFFFKIFSYEVFVGKKIKNGPLFTTRVNVPTLMCEPSSMESS